MITCREKYFADHPEVDPSSFKDDEGLSGCPSDFGYVDETGDLCCNTDREVTCKQCWDQKINENVGIVEEWICKDCAYLKWENTVNMPNGKTLKTDPFCNRFAGKDRCSSTLKCDDYIKIPMIPELTLNKHKKKPIDKVTIVARDVNGKREVYEFDSWDAVDVTGKDESEQILLILVGDVCIYSAIAHTWITWEVVRGFFA